MLKKLLRAMLITTVLSVLMYGGFIDAKSASQAPQQTVPPIALKLELP